MKIPEKINFSVPTAFSHCYSVTPENIIVRDVDIFTILALCVMQVEERYNPYRFGYT